MARFGLLDSDSDSGASDGDHSTSTARRSRSSRSASAAPSHGGDSSFASSGADYSDDEDEGEDQAPPRESLMQDDDASSSFNSDGEELDDEEGDEAMDDTFLDHGPRSGHKASAGRSTRSVSTFSHGRSRSQSLLSQSRTPSPPPTSRRGALPPSARQQQKSLFQAQQTQQQGTTTKPWAAQLKLDPARVAVMQASFFGQGQEGQWQGEGQGEGEEEEQEQEREEGHGRETKRRAVDGGSFGFGIGSGAKPSAAPPLRAPEPVPTPILDPAPFRPLRPFSSVRLSSSLSSSSLSSGASAAASIVDAGLALGRSFRVGWGPKGEVVSLKGINGEGGKDGAVKVEKMRLVSNTSASLPSSLRLLALHLAHTEVHPPSPASSSSASSSAASAPAAVPSAEMRFGHVVELLAQEKKKAKKQQQGAGAGAGGDDDDTEEEQQEKDQQEEEEHRLFALGALLFDEIPSLAVPPPSDEDAETSTLNSTYTARIAALRRRDALSQWLEEACAPAAASTLASLPPLPSSGSAAAGGGGGAAAAAQRIFALLAAHQIPAACSAAVSSQNLRLATLLAQLAPAGSGAATSEDLKRDVHLQLAKWREYGVDVGREVRRVWEVLGGNLGASEGADGGAEFHVLDREDVGWKEALGMGLWYGARTAGGDGEEEEEVADAVRRYESAFSSSSSVARPLPSYVLRRSGASPTATAEAEEGVFDPAFHLLKLSTSPSYPLSALLAPRNYGPSRTDYRVPWTLYVLLSRVLRRRDFEDREEVGEGAGEGEVEGNSVTADRLTESYAAQLEAQGEWGWAGFVLLFLELEAQRAAALRALLARHAAVLGEDAEDEDKAKVRFLVDECKVPEVWVWSARADYLLSLPSTSSSSLSPSPIFQSYTHLLLSHRAPEAHLLAVEQLVPEAIIRGDVGLVRRLVEPFVVDEDAGGAESGGDRMRGSVEGWEEGGQVFLLYLAVLASCSSSTGTSLPDPALLARALAATQALAARAASTPRTRGNWKLRLAVGEMVGRLNVLAKAGAATRANSASASLLDKLQPSLLPPSDRSVWIQGANRSFWEGSLGRAGAGAGVAA